MAIKAPPLAEESDERNEEGEGLGNIYKHSLKRQMHISLALTFSRKGRPLQYKRDHKFALRKPCYSSKTPSSTRA
ncbi:hypothetical protein SRHO_G00147550 [Serrasalmus rhombeus]